MALRDLFIRTFGILSGDACRSDFDQGESVCMFEPSLRPFGPFIVPEWALYSPVTMVQPILAFFQRHRGMLTVFLHPNTGWERFDHGQAGAFLGEQYPLDLTDFEFSEQLPPLFNTSCRNEPAIYPQPTGEAHTKPGFAHVRGLSMQPVSNSILFNMYINDGALKFSNLRNTDQTFYADVQPGDAVVCVLGVNPQANLKECISTSFASDQYYSFVFFQGQLIMLKDNNQVGDNEAKIRVVNFINGTTLTVVRDEVSILSPLQFMGISAYDTPSANAQHTYKFYDQNSNLIVTEPYYTNAGSVETIYIMSGIASQENANAAAILSFDYPRDSPF